MPACPADERRCASSSPLVIEAETPGLLNEVGEKRLSLVVSKLEAGLVDDRFGERFNVVAIVETPFAR